MEPIKLYAEGKGIQLFTGSTWVGGSIYRIDMGWWQYLQDRHGLVAVALIVRARRNCTVQLNILYIYI